MSSKERRDGLTEIVRESESPVVLFLEHLSELTGHEARGVKNPVVRLGPVLAEKFASY